MAGIPFFFDDYSPSKVQEIIANSKAGKIASIQIQYDRNPELAKKIAQEIQRQTSVQLQLSQSSPPDSATASYERNRVTAIIRSK